MRQTADAGIDRPVRIDHGSHRSMNLDEERTEVLVYHQRLLADRLAALYRQDLP